MSISQGGCIAAGCKELSATQRHLYSQTPDAAFFEAFQAAYDRLEEFNPSETAAPSSPETATNVGLLCDTLGATQTELAGLRGVSLDDQREYARILDRAYGSGGMNDPTRFLQSLSSSELDVVRRIRSLADPINPGGLSDEGAANLLLPEGYSVDLNRDGIDEVGLAKTLHFPPRDAPAAFNDAWFQATRDMSFGEYATHAMTFLVAFHPPAAAGATATAAPTDQLDSYQAVVNNYLSMLDRCRGMLAEGQYERDHAFFNRLKNLLEDASLGS